MKLNKIKRVIVSTALAFCVTVSVLAGTASAGASNDYENWLQTDSTWGSMLVGNSGDTMHDIGCAITATAILMKYSHAVTDPYFTPGTYLADLNSMPGALGPEGDIIWSVAVNTYGVDFYYEGDHRFNENDTQSQKAEVIRDYLDKGYYVMVRLATSTGAHFVAIEDVKGDMVFMMDPASTATNLFAKYQASRVTQLRLFKRNNAETGMAAPPFPGFVEEELPAPPMPVVVEIELPAPPAPFPTETELPAPPAPVQEETLPNPTLPPVSGAVCAPSTEPADPPTPALPEVTEPPVTTEAPTDPTEPTEPPAPPTPPMPSMETIPGEDEVVLPEDGHLPPQIGMEDRLYISFGMNAVTEETIAGYLRPDSTSKSICSLPEGAELRLTLVAEDFSWGLAEYDGRLCWVELAYLRY